MLENAKEANVDVMMLTVDTITGGNREREGDCGEPFFKRLWLLEPVLEDCPLKNMQIPN